MPLYHDEFLPGGLYILLTETDDPRKPTWSFYLAYDEGQGALMGLIPANAPHTPVESVPNGPMAPLMTATIGEDTSPFEVPSSLIFETGRRSSPTRSSSPASPEGGYTSPWSVREYRPRRFSGFGPPTLATPPRYQRLDDNENMPFFPTPPHNPSPPASPRPGQTSLRESPTVTSSGYDAAPAQSMDYYYPEFPHPAALAVAPVLYRFHRFNTRAMPYSRQILAALRVASLHVDLWQAVLHRVSITQIPPFANPDEVHVSPSARDRRSLHGDLGTRNFGRMAARHGRSLRQAMSRQRIRLVGRRWFSGARNNYSGQGWDDIVNARCAWVKQVLLELDQAGYIMLRDPYDVASLIANLEHEARHLALMNERLPAHLRRVTQDSIFMDRRHV